MEKDTKEVTIPKGVNDPHYRYNRQVSQIRIDKHKTYVTNISSIAKQIGRHTEDLVKWFQLSLPLNISFEKKTLMIYGKSDSIGLEGIEDTIEKFVAYTIICKKCGNPETKINSSGKMLCKACGHVGIVTNNRRVADYVDYLKAKKESVNKEKSLGLMDEKEIYTDDAYWTSDTLWSVPTDKKSVEARRQALVNR